MLADYCDLEFCGIYDGSSQALGSTVFVRCQLLAEGFVSNEIAAQ